MIIRMDTDTLMDVVKSVKAVIKQEDHNDMLLALGPDRWVVKVQSTDQVMAGGVRVREEAMDHYEKRGVDKLAIDGGELYDFLSGASGTVEVRYDTEGNKLYYNDGEMELETGVIAPNAVSNVLSDFPDVDLPVKIKTDIDTFTGRVDRASGIIGTDKVSIDARDNNVYMYMSGDTKSMVNPISWEDFDDYSVDWSDESTSDKEYNQIMSMFGADFITGIYAPSDDLTVSMGDDKPIMFRFSEKEGISVTYFIAPRLSNNDNRDEVPYDSLLDEDKY